MWGTKLCFVELSSNKSLRKIPDSSNCSGLENIVVRECSSSVEPIKFHTCVNLRVLRLLGNDVPEVQSIQSCPKLGQVQLAWKATHKSLPLLDDLHCLSELEIKGPSAASFDQISYFSPLLGEKQFWKQYPKDNVVFHELPGVGVLTNMQTVILTCIPLGKLPVKLAAGGSSLQTLFLDGCLLSKSVDFSAFPNLHRLSIRWTNVEEVCGLEHLKNLRYLDCDCCFRLRKVPDLRPSSMLKFVSFIQCPKLQSIPRLPPGCDRFSRVELGDVSEDERRAILATLAFVETTARALPPPGFGFHAGLRSRVIPPQLDGGYAIHMSVACDGCRAFPIVGRRYSAKPVATLYNLCSNCFSKTCYCSERRKPRWKAEGKLQANYDLCSLCYAKSGCDLSVFYEIDETRHPDIGLNPEVTLQSKGSEVLLSVSVSGVSTSYKDSSSFEVFTLKVKESPFDMTQPILRFKFGGS